MNSGDDLLIKWTPELSVNSPTLDLHHQILVGSLNRLHALRDHWQSALPAVGKELWMVINYCRIHFFVEEKAMEMCGIPEKAIQDHQKVHRSIVKKMGALWESFTKRPRDFPFEDTLKFLQVWLVKHVKEEDKNTYSEKIRANKAVEKEIRKIRYADVARKLDIQSGNAHARDINGARIIVAEKNLDRRTSMMRALQQEGTNVSQANSLGEVRTTLDAQAPDALIVGWDMEGAKELIHDLYENREVPVIVSYFGEFHDIIDEAEVLGAANILKHPSSAKDVVSVVKTTLQGVIPMRALVNQQEEQVLQAATG